MPWASMLYHLDFLPGSKSAPDFYAPQWDPFAKRPERVLAPPLIPPDEGAESSETESGSDPETESDDGVAEAPTTPTAPTIPTIPTAPTAPTVPVTPPRPTRPLYAQHTTSPTTEANLDGSPIQYTLPQRPGTAITRNSNRSWAHRSATAVRLSARLNVHRARIPANLTPITNDGLQLPSHQESKTVSQKPRSEDRIRAAQRLFHALKQSPRTEAVGRAQTRGSQPEVRSRVSLLHGLTAQAYRRNSEPQCAQDMVSHNADMPQFTPTMHGTQQCVIATQTNAIALVITPPSPRPDGGEGFKPDVTGIRIASHHTRDSAVPVPKSPTLQPPAFELAPGRARQMAQRRREAAERHTTQYAQHSRAGACTATITKKATLPPAKNVQMSPGRPFLGPVRPAPLLPKETTQRPQRVPMVSSGASVSTCKYVPPGRRRCMPGQVFYPPLAARVARPLGEF